jgi:hypothetical protein
VTQLELNLLPQVLAGTSIALKVLQARLLVMVAMALTFLLFAWSMWNPSTITLSIAAAFAALVFLPVLVLTREKRYAPQPRTETVERVPSAPTSIAA